MRMHLCWMKGGCWNDSCMYDRCLNWRVIIGKLLTSLFLIIERVYKEVKIMVMLVCINMDIAQWGCGMWLWMLYIFFYCYGWEDLGSNNCCWADWFLDVPLRLKSNLNLTFYFYFSISKYKQDLMFLLIRVTNIDYVIKGFLNFYQRT